MASAAVRVAANLELAKSEKKTDEELLAELMAEGQQGVEPTPWYLDKDNVEGNSCKSKAQRWYIDRALAATEVAENEKFQNFMVAIICIAGLLVGVSTYFDEGQPVIVGIDLLILVCFGFECGVKFLACGMAPWFYVHPSNEEWAWNVFDFSVFFLSLPVFPFKGDSIKLLRLFRLTRTRLRLRLHRNHAIGAGRAALLCLLGTVGGGGALAIRNSRSVRLHLDAHRLLWNLRCRRRRI